MPRINFHPAARADFDESFDWYIERSPHAALAFSAAVDSAVEAISVNPHIGMKFDEIHRTVGVNRFPFRVAYRVMESEIWIIAIVHAKRRPGYWSGR